MAFARAAGLWLAAWLGSAALWMVLTDSVRVAEMVAGAGVAALAATGFEVVRRQRVAGEALRPGLVAASWRVLARLVPDVGRLTRAAFAQLIERRASRGVLVAIAFRGEPDDVDARARAALASGVGSMAPNSIVVGVDPEQRLMLVHQLEPTREPADLDPLGLR